MRFPAGYGPSPLAQSHEEPRPMKTSYQVGDRCRVEGVAGEGVVRAVMPERRAYRVQFGEQQTMTVAEQRLRPAVKEAAPPASAPTHKMMEGPRAGRRRKG